MKIVWSVILGVVITVILLIASPLVYFSYFSNPSAKTENVFTLKSPVAAPEKTEDSVEFRAILSMPASPRFKDASSLKGFFRLVGWRDAPIPLAQQGLPQNITFPYELKFLVPRDQIKALLAKDTEIPIRLTAGFCQNPLTGCENSGGLSLQMSAWLILKKAEEEKKFIDLGERQFNFAILPDESKPGTTCASGTRLAGSITATPEAIQAFKGKKTVLFVHSNYRHLSLIPELKEGVNIQEITFTEPTIPFALNPPLGPVRGYASVIAVCERDVSNIACVERSGILTGTHRSKPFSKERKYAQLVNSGFEQLECGEQNAKLLVHSSNKSGVIGSFNVQPANLPVELRASPWSFYCTDCVTD